MTFSHFLFSLFSTLTSSVYADGYGVGILNTVGRNLPKPPTPCSGGNCLVEIVDVLRMNVFQFTGVLGAIFIMVAAIRLLTKSSEDEIANARRSVMTVMIGVILAVLSNIGFLRRAIVEVDNDKAILALCGEFLGIISVIVGIAGLLAVIVIAITGIRSLITFGEGDAGGDMRHAVGGIVVGAFILGLKQFVFPAIGIDDTQCVLLGVVSPVGLVAKVLEIVFKVFQYLEVIAIFIIVVLGILMIVNLGNEEQLSKLKSYLFRLAIGFIVLAMVHLLLRVVIVGTIVGTGTI